MIGPARRPATRSLQLATCGIALWLGCDRAAEPAAEHAGAAAAAESPAAQAATPAPGAAAPAAAAADHGAAAPGDHAAAAPAAAAPTQPRKTGAVLDARGTGTALERALLARGQPPEAPLELRRATRAMMIYAEPRLGAKFRGKLPHGESFAVFEHVGGDAECARGAWGRIGISAFVCLEHTVRHERKPIELPRLARGQLTPYYYARVKRKDANGEHPHAPRWRSRGAMIAGAEPVDVLVPDHDYAFEYRRPSPKGTILVDGSQRVVREADVRRLEPSAFAGHDAVATPLPGDTRLAWSIVWPHASIRSDRNAEAAVVGRVPLQAEIFVDDELVRRRGIDWITVPAGADGRGGGYVDASEIRRWFPALRPAGVGDEELWIDVELEQQTLAVMLGDAPLFVTMIASGNHKHPTPQGVYRIKTKMATSTMDSQPGDDEAYSVESVPWAQFFYKRYGLHGTFWHNRFGRRTSHGCVNLSARDAALVYAMTTPDPLPGWAMSFEHRDELGTVVRVRKLDAEVPDRRERVEDEATEESPRLE